MPVLIVAALVVVYIILGILYESFIHPLVAAMREACLLRFRPS